MYIVMKAFGCLLIFSIYFLYSPFSKCLIPFDCTPPAGTPPGVVFCVLLRLDLSVDWISNQHKQNTIHKRAVCVCGEGVLLFLTI
jgi:hypothetical protein